LGREGSDVSVSLVKEHYDMLLGLSTPMSVTTRCLGLGITNAAILPIVSQYFGNTKLNIPDTQTNSFPSQPDDIGKSIKPPSIHWPLSTYADEGAPSARAYASPIVAHPNMMPMKKRFEATALAINERVTKPSNAGFIPDKRLLSLAHRFIRTIVPVAGVGHPLSLEETRLNLNKPRQCVAIQNIWETVDADIQNKVECFIKNEPTNKPNRIISSFRDFRFILQFSAYSLSFREAVLHDTRHAHWFMPGKTPAEITDAVCEYVVTDSDPMEADVANFDGSIYSWLHDNVVNACYHRFFSKRYTRTLKKFTHMLSRTPKAVAKAFGFRYEAGDAVRSGAPTTCDGNTLITAFLMFCAIALEQPEWGNEEVLQELGLAFGDDSLFKQTYKEAYTKVAKMLRIKLEIEPFEPEKGVMFLSRVFVDPWNTKTSIADPLRVWRKLHMTTRDPNVPLAVAAVDRLSGYLVTDSISPVTSSYCRAVIDYYVNSAEYDDKYRHDRDEEKPYWSLANGAWVQDPEDYLTMWDVTVARTGFSKEQLFKYVNNLNVHNMPILNDNEMDSPYKNTLADDNLPSVPVDPVNLSEDIAVINGRAIDSDIPADLEIRRRLLAYDGTSYPDTESTSDSVQCDCQPASLEPEGVELNYNPGSRCRSTSEDDKNGDGADPHCRSEASAPEQPGNDPVRFRMPRRGPRYRSDDQECAVAPDFKEATSELVEIEPYAAGDVSRLSR